MPSQPEGLLVWHKALDLLVECYSLSDKLPRRERFGLCSQIERASVSVASSIAEGHGRSAPREFNRYLGISRGSIREIQTFLAIFERLSYFTTAELAKARELASEVNRMIVGLRAWLFRRIGSVPENAR